MLLLKVDSWWLGALLATGFLLAGGFLLLVALRIGRSDPASWRSGVVQLRGLPPRPALLFSSGTIGLLFALGGDTLDFATTGGRFLFAIFVLHGGHYFFLLLHELGHLTAGLAVGGRPLELRIGERPDCFSRSWGTMQLVIGLWPTFGLVRMLPQGGKWSRGPFLLFIAGGPVASLAAFAAMSWLCQHQGGRLSLAQSSWPASASVLWLVSSGMVLPGLFGIADVERNGTRYGTDLRLFWETWRGREVPANLLAEFLQQGKAREAWELMRYRLAPDPPLIPVLEYFVLTLGAEEAPELNRWAEAFLQCGDLSPTDRSIVLLLRGAVLVRLGQVDEARRLLAEAESHATTAAHEILLSEKLVQLVIEARLLELLPEADAASLAALQLEPHTLTLKGSRGSILVELRRFAEGMEMLERVFAGADRAVDQSISAFYLALGHHELGHREEAERWREAMLAHQPAPWLVKRAATVWPIGLEKA